ncbi:MAG: hypothetical protein VX986_08070 [Pseudomonadota bacterium]|nr:hypothetical protein [Pseudomonadota bacterium]
MRFWSALIVLTFFSFNSTSATRCPSTINPGEGVESYLSAMQHHRFEDAYSFVTSNMTDGRSMQDWARLQQYFYIGGEVVIFGISVRNAVALKGDSECKDKAIVPNVLRSRDKFNNQGTTEFELYSMVKENGIWKVDSLEVLFEEKEIERWFPEDNVPIFRDQHP